MNPSNVDTRSAFFSHGENLLPTAKPSANGIKKNKAVTISSKTSSHGPLYGARY